MSQRFSCPQRRFFSWLLVIVLVCTFSCCHSKRRASAHYTCHFGSPPITVTRNVAKVKLTRQKASETTTPELVLRHKTQRHTRHGSPDCDIRVVQFVAPPPATPATSRKLVSTLLRGALLRITSDLAGGTVFENIKTRVTISHETMGTAAKNIVRLGGGWHALWSGSTTRSVEGFFVGAVFMLGSTVTKQQLRAWGAPPTVAALSGGLVGGIGQALVMTPAGMVFTSLNVQRSNAGNNAKHINALTVTRQIVREQGWRGMYSGFCPMALRQASNWASRAGLTEVARSVLGLQRYGVLGEIGSGILGGIGSCWNTPIEMVRVKTQRDIGLGLPPKTITGYWRDVYQQEGPTGLFRGVSPRALQAVWQTCFMVVVPNLMGI